ncbi:hypothetical protein [Paenibacillus sp.]|uniref:hypothetical protein n=1 Tax=Paenibacillus sp. TaxID=58172 RepID=UPI002811E852|nr:hypothetical protein [Paenibacillus sp.]
MHPYYSQIKKRAEHHKSSRELKKQLLLNKMRQLQSASDTKQPAGPEPAEPENRVAALLRQNRRLKQSVKSLEKSEAAKSTKLAALQASNRALSRELKAAKMERYQANEAWRENQCQVNALKDRLAQLEQAGRELSNERWLMERKVDELYKMNRRHQEASQQMRRTIAQAAIKARQRKLQLKELEKRLESSRSLMEQAQFHADRIRQLEQELASEQGKLQPVELLVEQLLGKLDLTRSSHEAVAEKLQWKLKRMLHTLRSLREHPMGMEQRMYIHGYIMKSQNDHYFYDLEQNMYSIESDGGEWESDLPARAVRIDEDRVRILKQYSYHYSPPGTRNRVHSGQASRPAREESGSRSVDFIFPNQLKVLLLGSRNRTPYIRALERSNVEVDWFDGYEEDPHVLKQKWGASQIIIVCTRHVPHFVLDIVNRHEDRVQCMDRDNIKSLLVRVRHTALKLGLM